MGHGAPSSMYPDLALHPMVYLLTLSLSLPPCQPGEAEGMLSVDKQRRTRGANPQITVPPSHRRCLLEEPGLRAVCASDKYMLPLPLVTGPQGRAVDS